MLCLLWWPQLHTRTHTTLNHAFQLQLCAEDYRWWWRSYMVPASAGLYLFVYSIFYYATHLSMTWVAALLYFGYMSIISTFFGMMCGVVGHYACFWFTRKIYSAVKVD